jgi:iron complex outermembrane receptor protein
MVLIFNGLLRLRKINQLAGRNPLSILNQQNNFGTSYRSIGNIQTEYKMHFLPELKAVANFGYDELRKIIW